MKEYKKEKFGSKILNNIKGKIEFQNVDFSYNEDTRVLKDINLKVNEGQMVGVVGESGGGKSTLLSLISKMYDINKGKILIDNVNINDLTESSLRGAISYVSQAPYIFNTTILNNLRLANAEITEEKAIKACKLANIHKFIDGTEKGYDTIVGENGVQLSGGQKQRIAIARALINKNPIILLDEATSALDNESQNKIKEAIDKVAKNHTIIIVAHRLSTIINSDRIIAFKNGELIADGTHSELLKTNKYYKELYNANEEN